MESLRMIGQRMKKSPDCMTFQQFLCIATPLERMHHRNAAQLPCVHERRDKVESAVRHWETPLVAVADNLRSAFNVGSVLRTAECLGVRKVYLCGYTPLPTDDSTSPIARASLGTESAVEWEWRRNTTEVMLELSKAGYHVVALETKEAWNEVKNMSACKNLSLFEFDFMNPVALILGNERHGLNPKVLTGCSTCLTIPVAGRKESLNVATAFAIVAGEAARQHLAGSKKISRFVR
eukprot:CAMPEP_0170173058 /NCGR_PEP_ID=MMETSP0040_2-20121228/6327_1 /TAXON_ID=641309 /ORGANISM="Lotharella oceanica, Strain CCMP622" /LENGTH=235 /DNA_ID=CAMNT_0010414045 /DNA_START=198 /DNA_END=905 /DNA_ORIENTATION=+